MGFSRSRQIPSRDYRVRIFSGLVILFFIGFAFRLYDLQVRKADQFTKLALGQHGLDAKLLPTRGEIKVYDKFSQEPFPIATNIKKPLAYAVPSEIQDIVGTTKVIAALFGQEAAEVEKKLGQSGRSYVPLKKDLSKEEQEQLENKKIPGIYIDYETSRFYPEQELLSNVLGFTAFQEKSGPVRVGIYGLERSFEDELAGKPGSIKTTRDAKGLWLFGGKEEFQAPENGDQLVLSVDRAVQLNAEKVLSETVTQHQADGGCIIIVEPKTGSVLAMASNPNFNPNEYNKVDDPRKYQNLCTQGNYEPGSVFKPLVMAAAVDVGSVKPDTEFDDKGVEEIAGYQIKNSDNKAHGRQNMVQVLEKSLNTGMIFVQRQLGNARFKTYMEKFGFGKSTGIEVLERAGSLENLKGSIELNYATSAFGQGILVTPIQLIKAYTALANGGVMTSPRLVQFRIKPGGETVDYGKDLDQAQVLSTKTATTIGAMLVSVVENGHGKKAGVKGYYIAGKTGTAQVARSDGKGYDPDNNIGTFIGFGPAEDPKFLMLVRIDHPRTVMFAESTAAPAFGQLASFLLSYYNIPPTRGEK